MSVAGGSSNEPGSKPCPKCGQLVAVDARTCGTCGSGTVTLREAYGTDLKKGGFGLLDVIPGVRDLPPAAKVVLLIAIMLGLFVLFGR